MRPNTYDGAKMIAKVLMKEFRSRGEPVRLCDSFEAVARGLGFQHWHEVAKGFHPDRMAPWSDTRAAAVLAERCAVAAGSVAEALDAVGRRFGHWS